MTCNSYSVISDDGGKVFSKSDIQIICSSFCLFWKDIIEIIATRIYAGTRIHLKRVICYWFGVFSPFESIINHGIKIHSVKGITERANKINSDSSFVAISESYNC